MNSIGLVPGELEWNVIRLALSQKVNVSLDASCHNRIAQSFETVRNVLDEGRTVYGINTGFGLLANTRIPADQLRQLQKNLVSSHAAGVGEPLPKDVVRLLLLLKVNCLAQGHSGVSPQLIERLLQMLNEDCLPWIPCKGSVGASGDLAPLAHFSQTVLGEGFFLSENGDKVPAAEHLERLGWEPMELQPKEGLALLNGTQVSTALALGALWQARLVFDAAIHAGAMSVDAAKGSDAPFDARIHEVRGHAGQADCARMYRELLQGSEIRLSHVDCERVQDPYSLRCQPQVMGACLDQINYVEKVLICESNAVSDNPLVFSDHQDILSGGNFHAEPVAFAADNLALAVAEIGSLAERRIALLIDQHLSELPPFLIEEGGLNSGFMIPQVTASALASENKSLAHPASVDSLPTSANQEDHVSMATFAARRLFEMNRNTANIIAIELLCAAQGVDFRRPLKSSQAIESLHAKLREISAFIQEDRSIALDIESIANQILSGKLID